MNMWGAENIEQSIRPPGCSSHESKRTPCSMFQSEFRKLEKLFALSNFDDA